MLGKLIKYEFKHTSKTIFTTWAVLAAATLMGSLALLRLDQGDSSDATFSVIMSGVMLILYIIALIGIYCVDFIYLCYHYHKTMYSSQGYLTHTLPVSPAATLGVKIFTLFVWMTVSSVLLAASVLILLQVGSGGEFFNVFSTFSWEEFALSVDEIFGMSVSYLIFLAVVQFLLCLLYRILWITASMAIGQLFQNGHTGFSILAGFCIYLANQIVNTIFLAATGYNLNAFLEGTFSSFMNYVMGGSIGIGITFIVLLYGICFYINKKKLNLE